MEEFDFGSEYIVHIEETEGYDYFKPSTGLQKKLSDEGVKSGDKINITKVKPDEKYTYGYFTVSMVENVKMEDKGVENFEKQLKSVDKLDMHELTLRVKTLEDKVQLLMNKDGDLPY